jgi:hypothetical protein
MRTRLLLLGGLVALVAAVAVVETRHTPPPPVATLTVATAAAVSVDMNVSMEKIVPSAALATRASLSENLRSSANFQGTSPPSMRNGLSLRKSTSTPHLDYRPARYIGTMEGWGFL